MNKKAIKIAAFFAAVILIVGLGIFANGLVGNPVSKMMASKAAGKYLEKNYSGTDFFVESVSYSFKDGNYYAHIKAPDSEDRYFSLCISPGGKVKYDTYEDITDGTNTARRLEKQYRDLADTVLENSSFPYKSDIQFGELEFIPETYAKNEDVPFYAIIQDELEVDQAYDIRKLGERAGHLILYVDDETVNAQRAGEIMRDIRCLMEEGGVPFYAMDFVLQYPGTGEDGVRREGNVEADNFLCSDIYEEGMTERVEKADAKTKAYYESIDK